MAKIPNWTLEQVNNVSEVAEGEPLAYWTEDDGDRTAEYHFVQETFDEPQEDDEKETVTKRVYRGFVGDEKVSEETAREPCRVETVEAIREEGEKYQQQQSEGYTIEQLEEMTKDDLYKVAQEIDIEGRSSMLKGELLAEIKGEVLEEVEQ